MFVQTNQQLSDAIKNDALLVDVRTPDEFSSGSVNGAINIPLDQLRSQLSEFESWKSIVVFCRSGSRSNMAKSILEQSGFNNVINGGAVQNVYQAIQDLG